MCTKEAVGFWITNVGMEIQHIRFRLCDFLDPFEKSEKVKLCYVYKKALTKMQKKRTVEKTTALKIFSIIFCMEFLLKFSCWFVLPMHKC